MTAVECGVRVIGLSGGVAIETWKVNGVPDWTNMGPAGTEMRSTSNVSYGIYWLV